MLVVWVGGEHHLAAGERVEVQVPLQNVEMMIG